MSETNFLGGWLNPNNMEKSEPEFTLNLFPVESESRIPQVTSQTENFDSASSDEAIVPEDVRARLYVQREISRIQTDSKIEIMNHENIWRLQLMNADESIRERRMKKIEENRERRDLASFGVYEDSEGRLCYELKDCEGNRIGTKTLTKCRRLSLTCFWSNHRKSRKETYLVRWENPDGQIALSKCSPQEMEKKLAKAGVAIQCGKERRKVLVDLLFAFLREHMVEHELPYTVGWNRMSSGRWHFEPEYKKTLRGLNG